MWLFSSADINFCMKDGSVHFCMSGTLSRAGDKEMILFKLGNANSFSFFFSFSLFGHTMQHVESLFPNQGLNARPLQWKRRVLTTGQPGNSPLSRVHFELWRTWMPYYISLPLFICLRISRIHYKKERVSY